MRRGKKDALSAAAAAAAAAASAAILFEPSVRAIKLLSRA